MIIRHGTRQRWTTVDRDAINDEALSFRARGVLIWLLDKPDNWEVRSSAIAGKGKEGRDAIRAALAELETRGYLVREKRQTQGGHWVTESWIYEQPVEMRDNRSLEIRESETQALTSSSLRTNTNAEDSEPKVKIKGARKDDLLFESLVAVCQYELSELTPNQRGKVNAAAKQLRAVGATPEQVAARGAQYRTKMPGAVLTPNALANHWAGLGVQAPSSRQPEFYDPTSDPTLKANR